MEKETTQAKNKNALLPPVRWNRELWRGVRAGWDNLGLVMAISLTWTLLLSAALSLALLLTATLPPLVQGLLTALLLVLFLSAPTAGAFVVAHRIAAQEAVSYLDFWRSAAQLWRAALILGLVHLFASVLFVANLSFYLSLRNMAGLAALVLCLYTLLFWLMMTLYHLPVLVAQEAGVFDEEGKPARRGVIAVLRRSFYLAFGTPFFTLGLLSALLLITALLFLTGVLAALLWAGLLPLLITYPTRALLIRYGVLPVPVAAVIVPDEQFRIKTP